MWLSLGGFHERGHDWESDRRIYNTHVIIDDKGTARQSPSLNASQDLRTERVAITPTGGVVSVYRKSHLFDVELPEKGVSLKESAFTLPGPSLVPPVQTPIGKVLCFDSLLLLVSTCPPTWDQ